MPFLEQVNGYPGLRSLLLRKDLGVKNKVPRIRDVLGYVVLFFLSLAVFSMRRYGDSPLESGCYIYWGLKYFSGLTSFKFFGPRSLY